MESASETSRILEKGPDYLRKQMDLESEAKGPAASAVERLAASRPKYVKSQQAVSATGEALVGPPLVDPPLVGPPLVGPPLVGPPLVDPPLVDPPLVDPPSGDRSSAPPRGSPQSRSPTQVRRSSSKKRPDSILLYRQKCELLRAGGGQRKHHITRKLLRSSASKPVSVPEAAEKEPDGAEEELGAPRPSAAGEHRSSTRTPTPERRRRGARAAAPKEACAHLLSVPASSRAKGVARSRSDISSRYSKNFADFDAFFKYCGLDGEVVESLGKENFSARSDETAVKLRSVSVSASDDGFSRDGSDGLQEEVLHEKIRQGTSVIERNARIIKWLYSCKNAKESGKKLRDLD
ncbi:protein FAM110C [Syngnathus acus]|uniref:protein FAM110C n=1 Tax=Syngnathus acus TaxID=161584 RepID=UPI0018863A15|nr:protein FAM110C [Syngnathus acus]